MKTLSLSKAVLSLKNSAEVEAFLRDLLTEAEIEEFQKRWLAAQLLDSGQKYEVVVASTRLSSRTVARVSKWLKSGKNGYRLVIDRLHHTSPQLNSG